MKKFRATVEFEAPDREHAENHLAAVLKQSKIKVVGVEEVPDIVRLWVATHGIYEPMEIAAGAYLIETPDGKQELGGSWLHGTKPRGLINAVIEGLDRIPFGTSVCIMSDDEYLISGMTAWGKQWRRNGWVTRQGRIVAHHDLWQILLNMLDMREFETRHQTRDRDKLLPQQKTLKDATQQLLDEAAAADYTKQEA